MLINHKGNKKGDRVSFVSYSGRWPNLCSGKLVLNIDGINYSFGWGCDNDFPTFWHSGGHIKPDYNGSVQDEWRIDYDELPDKFKELAEEIDRVFNENVDYGCCGGCI